MIDQAGSALQVGDDAVLMCEVLKVVEPGGTQEPGVVVQILNSDMQLFISAKKMPLRGMVVSEELMKLQTAGSGLV